MLADDIANIASTTRPGYIWSDAVRLINDPRTEPQAKQLYHANLGDIDSETMFLMSLLLLLNTYNATHRKAEDLTKLNKARRKQRKRELLGYDTIMMRLSKREREEPGRLGGGHGSTKSAHICKGHYKRFVKPDGTPRLVWWRAHWRGSGSISQSGRTRQVTL